MTWLWILAAITLLFIFLFTVRVKIVVSFDGSVALCLRVLGVRIPLLPKPTKKIRPADFTLARHKKRIRNDAERAAKKQQKLLEKKRKKAEKKAAQKKDKKKKLPQTEVTVKDEPSMVSLLLSVVGGVLDKFFGKLRVDLVRLRITVGGPDATKIAMTYGIVSQGVAYLMELIAQKTKFRRTKNEYISVIPDFLARSTTADISLIFTVNLWYFLNILFTFAFRFIKEKIRRESELT